MTTDDFQGERFADQEDQILLLIDNSRVTLDRIMGLIRQVRYRDRAARVSMLRTYIQHHAVLDLLDAGEITQAAELRKAILDRGRVDPPIGQNAADTYWSHDVLDHYEQKYAELTGEDAGEAPLPSLLNCPNCDGEVSIDGEDTRRRGGWFSIDCHPCGLSMHAFADETPQQLVERWNRRAVKDQSQLVAAMADVLQQFVDNAHTEEGKPGEFSNARYNGMRLLLQAAGGAAPIETLPRSTIDGDLLTALRECITDENSHAMASQHRMALMRRLRSINLTARRAIAKAERKSHG